MPMASLTATGGSLAGGQEYGDADNTTAPGSDPSLAFESEGPFRCDRCEYYHGGQCSKPEVNAKYTNGQPTPVQPGQCCNFFEKGGDVAPGGSGQSMISQTALRSVARGPSAGGGAASQRMGSPNGA